METISEVEASVIKNTSDKPIKARGLGSIYQRGNIYWIVYYINGRRIRESSHSDNPKAAMKLLKLRSGQAAIGRPVTPQAERTTLGDLTALLLDEYRANARRSLDRVEYAITHLHAILGADRRVITIDTGSIIAYQTQRQRELFSGRPVANATINYEIAMLRRAFRISLRAGRINVRPEFPMLKVDNARKGFFEADQYRAVVAELPDYLKPVAQAAYITGWRTKSELLSRQWRHVDLDSGWLRLDPGESKNGEGRMFPLTPDFRALLETQRDRVRAIERATGQVIPWIFPHADGSPIRNFRHCWKDACRAACVPGLLVHDFRRTAVRNLERAGVPRSAAMKITGHKTETVYRRYAIVDEGMMRDAAVKLATLHAIDATCAPLTSGKVVAIGEAREAR